MHESTGRGGGEDEDEDVGSEDQKSEGDSDEDNASYRNTQFEIESEDEGERGREDNGDRDKDRDRDHDRGRDGRSGRSSEGGVSRRHSDKVHLCIYFISFYLFFLNVFLNYKEECGILSTTVYNCTVLLLIELCWIMLR